MNRITPGLPVHHLLWSLLKLTSIDSVMPSNHLILCHPLLLLLPVPPSIRVFSNESTLRMRWPKYSPAAKAPASLGIPSPTRSRELAPVSPRAMDAARSEPSVVPRRPHPWWLRPWEATLVPEGKGEGPLGVRGGFPPWWKGSVRRNHPSCSRTWFREDSDQRPSRRLAATRQSWEQSQRTEQRGRTRALGQVREPAAGWRSATCIWENRSVVAEAVAVHAWVCVWGSLQQFVKAQGCELGLNKVPILSLHFWHISDDANADPGATLWVKTVSQWCPTSWNPTNYSPPGPSVHEILQARILEWVAIPFPKGSSRPRDRTWVSHIAGRFFTVWTTREALTCIQQWRHSTTKNIINRKRNFQLILSFVSAVFSFFLITIRIILINTKANSMW